MANHQPRVEQEDVIEGQIPPITERFIDKHLMTTQADPWFAKVLKYIFKDVLPMRMTYQQRRNFFSQLKFYYREEPFLYKQFSDLIIRRCAMEHQMQNILKVCHTLQADNHYGAVRTVVRVL